MRLQVSDDQLTTNARLDLYLVEQLPTHDLDLSRSKIQSLIKGGDITLNQKKAKPKDTLNNGDIIDIQLPEETPDIPQPEDIPLEVLYEDEQLLIINKPPGLVVHPANGNESGTLVNAALHHCQGELSTIGGTERPGIVHRLDKDTSGAIVIAKTDVAHASLVEQFSERSTEKIYLAVGQSHPLKTEDTVFTHIGRHPVNRQKMAVLDPPNGKPSITDYEVLYHDEATDSSLILCHLHTGRTHQIRVHMHHIGCPLIGDPIYSNPKRQKAKTGRLMLHAWRLTVTHPTSKKRIEVTAPIPQAYRPWTELDITPPRKK